MLETDENITKQSSAMPSVPSCSSHAPCAFGASTVRIRSRVSEASGASSITIAKWNTPLSE